jgi:acetoin utilization deacetylase AcuC-like enzyme
MTLLYSDPVFLEHATGHHPENAERLRRVIRQLEAEHLLARCKSGRFQPADRESILAVHEHQVFERARALAERGGGYLDPDTVVCPASFKVALHAAGACMAAIDDVVNGVDHTALCLVRPPGHHATPHTSMGFCLFNNIAVAAAHARRKHGLNRVLIVDWDVHHGNGTQDIFFADPSQFFLSVHRYGGGFYPGTGASDETGTGAGLGFTRNIPVHFGTSRSEYLHAFRNALEAAADRMKPELVLVSAGFDAHALDPVGSLGLQSEDFAVLTTDVLAIARAHAGGRLVACLEGGYNVDALAESVQIHLEELLRFQP